MNARERALKVLKRKGEPDRIPFEISWGSFTPLRMKTFRPFAIGWVPLH